MSDPTSSPSGEQNLLLCLLALQNGIITREQLLSAFSSWAADKKQDLVQLLVNQSAITEADLSLLRQMVKVHLRTFDGNAAASLAQISSVSTVKLALRSLSGDPQLAGEIPWFSETLDHGIDHSTNSNVIAETFDRRDANRFRIIKEHARGGLGVVYVAVDTQLRREVAVKQIRADRVSNSAYRDKFSLEAEVTGQLEHPGIVPVYALGVDETGSPFYAMRFVRGEDLQARIKQFHTRIRMKEETFDGAELRGLLRRFVDVCNAMEYAHDRGVLHRDLKPGNIMLGKHGETLVVDWGLAKASGKHFHPGSVGELSELPIQSGNSNSNAETVYGSFIGTPAYAPPEQVLGKLDELGPCSDVYSLGAILYELLSGFRAIEALSVDELTKKVIAGDFKEPRQRNKLISKSLNAVCMKSMATRSSDRYQNVGELRRDIESWLSDLPVTARREWLADRAHRWIRKHRSLAAASVLSILIIGLISTFAAYRMNYLRGQEAAARKQSDIDKASAQQSQKQSELDKTAAEAARKQVSEQSREFRLAAAEDFFEAGLFAYDAGNLEKSDRLLHHSWINAKASQELLARLQPVIFDRLTRGGRRIGLPLRHPPAASVQDVEFSYTGQYLVTNTGKQVQIWNSETSAFIAEVDIDPIDFVVQFIQCSPVANELLIGQRSTVKVFSIPDGKVVNAFRGTIDPATNLPKPVLAARFSNSGKNIAIGRVGQAVVYDLRSGMSLHNFTCSVFLQLPAKIYFNKDDTRLTYGPDRQPVATWIVGNNSPIPDKSFGGGGFIPRGTNPTFSQYTHDYSKISFDKFTLANPTVGVVVGHNQYLQVNPLGLIAATAETTTGRLWSLETGEPIGRYLHHAEPITDIAFSPDGTTIASGSMDATVAIWDAIDGKHRVGPLQHEGTVKSVRYSPDGMLLATASADKTARVWNVRTGNELARIPHESQVTLAAFHPSKLILATVSDASVHLWDLSADLPHFILRNHIPAPSNNPEFPYRLFRLSASGSKIATSSHGSVLVWDADSGREIGSKSTTSETVNDMAFSPDETQLAIATSGPTLIQWNLKENVTRTTTEIAAQPQLLRYSPDGSTLAVGAWSNDSSRDAYLLLVNTSSNIALGQHKCFQQITTGSRLKIEFSESGKLLFLASGIDIPNRRGAILTVMNATTVAPIREIHRNLSYIFKIAVVPKADIIAASTPESTVLYNWSTSELEPSLPGSIDVSFSYDGSKALIRSRTETMVLERITGKKLLSVQVNEQGATAKLCGADDGTCASLMVSKASPRYQVGETFGMSLYPHQTLRLIDIKTGWPIGSDIPGVRSFELSPDRLSLIVYTSEGLTRRYLPKSISEPIPDEVLNAITGYLIGEETGESRRIDIETLQRSTTAFLEGFLAIQRSKSPASDYELLNRLAIRNFLTGDWFACQQRLDELKKGNLLSEEQAQWLPVVKQKTQMAEDQLRTRVSDTLTAESVRKAEFKTVLSTIPENNTLARHYLAAAFAAEISENWLPAGYFYEAVLAEQPNNPALWTRYRTVLRNQAAMPLIGRMKAQSISPSLDRGLETQLSELDETLMKGASDEAASAVHELHKVLEFAKALALVNGSVENRRDAFRSLFAGELFDPGKPDWRLAVTYALNRSDAALRQSCVRAADIWFARLPDDNRPSSNWLKGYVLIASDKAESSLLPSVDSTDASAESCYFLAKAHLIGGRVEECKSAIQRSRAFLKSNWADKSAVWRLPWYQRVIVDDLYSRLEAMEEQLKAKP